jgi:hypothetical protein
MAIKRKLASPVRDHEEGAGGKNHWEQKLHDDDDDDDDDNRVDKWTGC